MELCLSLSGFRPLCQPWSCKSKRANSTEEFSSTERSSSRHNVAWENIVTMESPSQLQFLFPATFSGLTFHKPKLNMVSVSLFTWLSFYIEESSVNLYLQLCCLLHKDFNDFLSLNNSTFLNQQRYFHFIEVSSWFREIEINYSLINVFHLR